MTSGRAFAEAQSTQRLPPGIDLSYARRVLDPHLEATTMSKRTLVALSHAIERLALASAEDGPVLVIALFQRRPYYERERAVYERIAAGSAVTVVGVVEAPSGDAANGRGPVVATFGEHDELAKEWSVVVLTPRTGAMLVARDLERIQDDAESLEGGRLFDGRWSFRRDDALHEALRLQKALADLLPAAASDAVDAVVDRVRQLPAAPGEARVDAAVRFLLDTVRREQRRTAAMRRSLAATDARPEGHTADLGDGAVQRWIGTAGTTASGTLSVALLAVRVIHPGGGLQRPGRRGVGPETVGVLRVLQQARRPTDRMMRIEDGEYLLIMPSLTEPDVVEVAHRVRAQIAALEGGFPFGPVHAACAVTVTRQRPLPIPALRDALAWAVAEGVPVAAMPGGAG
jgi:DICT domain-containing protein